VSIDFEWHFGDELPKNSDRPEEPKQPSWRRWLPWLLALLLVAGSSYAWWRRRQVSLAQAEAEVQQIVGLELRALAEGDTELYLSLQDPWDRSWQEAQAAYATTGGLPLPLQDVTTPISTSVAGARVVGDRARVEVVYATILPSGEQARFGALRFYRYTNDGRWVHTSVTSDDLEHTVTFVVDDLKITSFANDADWLEPLASELAGVAYRVCQLASCRKDLSLTLNLAANLEEAAIPNDAVLPAPFLIGAPQNQAARTAWEASLGQFLVDRMIAREIGARPDDEGEGAFVEERLRAWLKAELNVSPPIDPDPELLRDALGTERWIPFWRLWNVRSDGSDAALATAQIDLLLTFLEQERGTRAVARLIYSVREADYLMAFLGETNRHWDTVESHYLAYVRRRTAPATDELGAFPAYDLLIPCTEAIQWIDLVTIWGWRFDQEEPVLLSARPTTDGFYPISWSPAGTRLLLGRDPSHETGYAILQAGSTEPEGHIIPDGAQPPYSYFGLGPSRSPGWSPDGSLLIYHIYRGDALSSGGETRVVNVTTGDEIALDGRFVAWSPGGAQLLYAKSSEPPPTIPDSEGSALLDFYIVDRGGSVSQRVGAGYAAAWSPDGGRIAYVDADQTLTVYHLTTARRTSLIEPGLLHRALGFTPSFVPSHTAPFILAWSPDGDWIALGVTDLGDDGPQAGAVLLAQDNKIHLLRREQGGIYDLAWAPDGRRLRVLSVGQGFSTIILERDGSVLVRADVALASWSPDGRYLAVHRFSEEGAGLEMVEMATGLSQVIELPGNCRPPIWNPRGPQAASFGPAER